MTEYGRTHTDGSRSGGQPISSDIEQTDIDAAESIFWVETIIDDHEAVAKTFARHRQYGYDQGYYDGQRDRPPTQSDALPAVGTEGRYVYEGMVELSCVVTAHVEGWLEVKFTLDDGEAIVRPSRFHAAQGQSK